MLTGVRSGREARLARAHKLTPSYTRLARRGADVRVVQHATPAIVDLNESLDRAMRAEPRPDERLRMLRETTKQITRAANDAIQAYRRARAAVHAELQMPGGDRKQAQQMQLLLNGGRADILRVLEVISRRYSWADPWPSPLRQNGSGRTRGR